MSRNRAIPINKLFAILICLPAWALGGEFQGIANPYLQNGSIVLDIRERTTLSPAPSCSDQVRNQMRLPSGEAETITSAKFVLLLSAWISATPVYVLGTGTCSPEGDELISAVKLQPAL